MITTGKQNGFYALVIFLISPLISLALAFRNYNTNWARNIVWLFVVFYALSFSIPSETSDANDYKLMVESWYRQDIRFSDFISNFYKVKPNYHFRLPFDDIFNPGLAYLVSRFTDNFRVFYFFVGLVFGFFYSRNIWFLIDFLKIKIKPIHILILIAFALVIPFWNLNSVRMWTAAHVFFYGAATYIIKGKQKQGLVFVLIPFFIHFSFVLPILVFATYLVTGPRLKVFFYAFLITLFINEIDFGAVRNLLTSFLPDFLHANVETYTPDERILAERAAFGVKKKSWHAVYYTSVLKWTVYILVIYTYAFCKDIIRLNPKIYSIYSFALLFLSFANFSSLMPSGGRFLLIAYLFVFVSFFIATNYSEFYARMKNLIYLVSPGLLFYGLVSLRIGFDSLNVNILGNFFTFLYFGSVELPLIELIK